MSVNKKEIEFYGNMWT